MDEHVKAPGYLRVSKVIALALYAWVLFGIIVLGIRVFLLAFSANPSTSFVNFIYTTSATFLEPFRGIFPPKAVSETGYLDVAALFAMIMYGLIGWGFSTLLGYIQSKIDAYKAAAKAHAAAVARHQQALAPNTYATETHQEQGSMAGHVGYTPSQQPQPMPHHNIPRPVQ
jgi:hypothetical protein